MLPFPAAFTGFKIHLFLMSEQLPQTAFTNTAMAIEKIGENALDEK